MIWVLFEIDFLASCYLMYDVIGGNGILAGYLLFSWYNPFGFG